MRASRIAVFAATLTLAAVSFGDTKKELEAAYAKFNSAVRAKDLKGAVGIFTKDLTFVDEKGVTKSRADVEKLMKAQFAYVSKVTTLTTKILKLTQKGDTVVADTEGVFEAMITVPGDKKQRKLRDASSTTDTWVKVKGAWMISKVVTTKSNTTFDGKKGG